MTQVDIKEWYPHTFLIQRLCEPMKQRDGHFAPASGPFTFGGGQRHGGLSDIAVQMLGTIFSFDYMGAAEFEFGAVPEALSALVMAFQAGKGRTGTIDTKRWRPAPKHEIYYICMEPTEEYVKTVIPALAALSLHSDVYDSSGIYNKLTVSSKAPKFKDLWLKERTLFASSLYDMGVGPKRKVIGWLELDNQFAFFIDKEAFERMTRAISDPGAYAKEIGVDLDAA